MPVSLKVNGFFHAARLVVLMLYGILCTAQNCLVDQRWMPAGDNQTPRLAKAPIVVVGTILSDRFIGTPRASSWKPGLMVQLAELTIDVETVLRGDMTLGKQTIYAFYHRNNWDGVRTLGSWSNDSRPLRKLFYLKRDCGVVRLVCDVRRACIFDVQTGSHSDSEAYKQLVLNQALARIFFTQGNGVTDQAFAESLWQSTYIVPHKEARPNLISLTQSLNQSIRHESCIALREQLKLPEAQMPSVCRSERRIPAPDDKRQACEVLKAADVVSAERECK